MQLTNKQQRKVVEFCQNQPEIIVAYLFGSQAKGTSSPLSDIDLAFLVDFSMVDQKEYTFGYQAHIITELIGILKTNAVDVVILNEAPPFLRFQVIYYGDVIFCRSENQRLAFHVKSFNEYQDFKPMLEVQHSYTIKRLKKRYGAN